MTGRRDQANKHSSLGRQNIHSWQASGEMLGKKQKSLKIKGKLDWQYLKSNLHIKCVLIQGLLPTGSVHHKSYIKRVWQGCPLLSEFENSGLGCILYSPQCPQIHCASFEGGRPWLLGTQLQRLQNESDIRGGSEGRRRCHWDTISVDCSTWTGTPTMNDSNQQDCNIKEASSDCQSKPGAWNRFSCWNLVPKLSQICF